MTVFASLVASPHRHHGKDASGVDVQGRVRIRAVKRLQLDCVAGDSLIGADAAECRRVPAEDVTG
jgi:hypothetical protein